MMKMSKLDNVPTISWNDFDKVLLCVGTVIRAEDFPEARKPALKLWINFGPYGTKTSSAQITDLYDAQSILGQQVLAVLNLEPKRIGGFVSECLVTGVPTESGAVALVHPKTTVPNGVRLF
jgi:tRNA-binding protein